MTDFRTIVNVEKQSIKINHNTPILMIGSCFSENIGEKLLKLKFHIDLNPFGIIYNPASIASCLKILIENKRFEERDLFFYEGLWHSFMHHSAFSSSNSEEALNKINNRISYSSEMLKKANYLILTFGTSWIYYHKPKQMIVANCHKIPSQEFERKLLNINEIVDLYIELTKLIRAINPQIKIIYTVSPVRHLKDTAHGNQISKAILLLAIEELCKQNIGFYFPAYEILLDELRDYRFYDTDMTHPSSVAIDYIFEKFEEAFFTEETKKINNQITNILKAAQHNFFNPETPQSIEHKRKTIEKIEELEQKYPFLNFDEEKEKIH